MENVHGPNVEVTTPVKLWQQIPNDPAHNLWQLNLDWTNEKNTEEGIILDRRRALEMVKDQGIVQKHQVLDNIISAAYKM